MIIVYYSKVAYKRGVSGENHGQYSFMGILSSYWKGRELAGSKVFFGLVGVLKSAWVRGRDL